MAGEAITWKDPTGANHALDGSGNYLALAGEQANYAPPVALLDQRTPQRPGTIIRYQDIQPRILTYPLVVTASSETNLRTAIRSLVSMFLTTSAGNPGTLIATAPDGSTQRQISSYYYAGLEGDGSEQNRGPGWAQFALQLEAPDPFWQDTSATTNTYTNTQMGSSQTINNTGDYQVWPKWTITGPFTSMIITNTTTGQKMDLSTIIGGFPLSVGGGGNTLVIDSLAGTIILNGTTNEIAFLTTASILFPLAVGNNVITWSYTGGVNGQTSTQVSYTNRYWSC